MIRTIVAMLALLGASGMASAQTPARVMTGYAATSGPHAVLWIAREAGLFDKNGIKAEVAYIRSGSTMAQTLVSGEIQLSQMGGPAMLCSRGRGHGCHLRRGGTQHDADRDHGQRGEDGRFER